MAFPADVKLVRVTCGTGYDFSGEPIAITLEVTPVLGGSLKRLIHAATGTFMTRDALTFKSDPGSPATFTVPSPAQAETWKDGSGEFFTNWSYSVTVTTRTASGKIQSWIQSFQPVDGQETVDLDLVPDGQIGSPTSAPAPAVTSVNGQSGAVVIDEGEAVTPESVAANLTVEAVGAKLPERLSESALSTAIGESVAGKVATQIAPMAPSDLPSGITVTRAYDPRTRSYNLNQSTLSKARAAHARGLNGGKPMQLHFLGHSYLTGLQTAPPYPTNTSPALVTRALDVSGRVGRVREGHRVLTYGTAVGARLSDDTRFTLAPEWTYISGHGYALASVYRNISNTGDLVFTPTVPVTHFEIVYLASTVTGAWSFSIDGGSFASTGITATNPTIGYFSRNSAASVEPAMHTLTIRPPASGHVMIQSIRAYTATATEFNAIEVTNAGVSGSTAGGATVGSWTHSLAGYASTAQAISFYRPDLACIMLGTNDRNAGYTKTAYIDAMRTLANQVKAAGGDVIFLREPTPTEQGFTDGLYGLADEIGAGIIEVGPDWPSVYATAKAEPYGYIGTDNGHPSPRGHTAIARAVANALVSVL